MIKTINVTYPLSDGWAYLLSFLLSERMKYMIITIKNSKNQKTSKDTNKQPNKKITPSNKAKNEK